MTATHTISEAQATELNHAIRRALRAVEQAGYARSSYVHDQRTHETILHRRRENAGSEAEKAQQAMWALFYDVMSRDAEVPA